MRHLEGKEWFLWRRHSEVRHPWNRQLNSDFLMSENKRIQETHNWMKNLHHASHGAKLDEVCYYVVPIKIRSGWLRLGHRGYTCKGLSALRNCPQNSLVAFFPSSKRIPKDYTLIKINSPIKTAILDDYTKSREGEYAIKIDAFEELESEDIYADVPIEQGFVSELIEENLNAETLLAESLQAPLVSSPFISGDIGGVSFASILGRTDFALELCKTMQLMLPPEFRSFFPPKLYRKGVNQKIGDGIDIHVAERIIAGRNYLSSVAGSKFNIMDPEIKRRAKFPGEYSIVGAMVGSQSMGRQLHNDMLHRFFESEVSIPNLDGLIDADAYIPNLTKVIDEDLWLQIASMRQKRPSIMLSDQEERGYCKKIEDDIEVVLCERMPEEYTDIVVKMKSEYCLENLKREAKSLARAEGKEYVDLSLLKHARGNFLDRFSELERNPLFQNIKYNAKRERGQARAFNVGMVLRELERATAEQIYREVDKTLFKDVEDLKGLLEWLHRNGFVVKTEEVYIWV